MTSPSSRYARWWLPGALLLLLSAACDDTAQITPTTPTTPTTTTDTFAGTLNPNGAVTHSFVVQTAGIITASLTSLTPDSTLRIGLSLGTWNSATSLCQIILANDEATEGTVMTGSTSSSGTFCVRVYDAAGTVPAPQSYEVAVIHP
jgi:hypothetical protein